MFETHLNSGKSFLSEQSTRLSDEDRPAFVEETARSTEATIVERLMLLLAAREREGCAATLRTLLERLPAQRLALILAEDHRHHFLPGAGVDWLLGQLSLAQLVALSEALAQQHTATLLALLERAPEQAYRLAACLLERLADAGGSRAATGWQRHWSLVGELFGRLNNVQVWELLRRFVQGHRDSAQALELALGTLESSRAAHIIGEQLDETAIRVYWVLFPADVRRVLLALGKGRLGVGPAPRPSQGQRRPTPEAPPAGRSSRSSRFHGWSTGKARKQLREQRTAMDRLVQEFGFRESMSYHEARQRYWTLACQWHPDHTGDSPVLQQKMRELNQAWNTTRSSFQDHAR